MLVNVCSAFRAPFVEVQTEAQKLLNNADSSTKLCFMCGQATKTTCARCKLASYCSVECQRSCWSGHKHLCKDMKGFLGLRFSNRQRIVDTDVALPPKNTRPALRSNYSKNVK